MKQVLWVLLLLAPAMVWAQEDFGPVQLDEGQAMNYYYPRVEADGSGNLLCAWSGVLPEEGTGFIKTEGAHVSPQGQVVQRVTFQQVPFGIVTCPGELHLLHGVDGSNPFMLYHSWIASFELLFISPEGQILDTLSDRPVTKPLAVTLPNGIFITFHKDSLQAQVLIWANYDGTITRQDTLDLNNIDFAYVENGNVVLVEYSPHYEGDNIVIDITLRPFAPDGTPLTPEPMYNETLAANMLTAGAAFDYTDGVLRTLVAVVELGSTPTTYSVRLIRHVPGNNLVYQAFNPGPFPAGYFATFWTITPGPWNTTVLGFAASNASAYQVWLEGLDENGQPIGLVHIENMPANEQVTAGGVRAVVHAGTVYAIYTIAPLPGGGNGGAYLVGFPQEEILAAKDEFIPHPSSFILSSYPNPFNSTVRLEYSLSAPTPVSLVIYDVTGREVGTLVSGVKDAGRHSVSWSADNLSSGIYLARLTAGDLSQVRKLVLLR